jgi:hypothetical protein
VRKSCEVTLSVVGTEIASLVKGSMITRIAVNLDEAGECSIKSIDIEFHGFSGTGSSLSRPF